MHAFKHTSAQFIEGILTRGAFKISRLSYFRELEHTGSSTADKYEGRVSGVLDGEVSIDMDEDRPRAVKQLARYGVALSSNIAGGMKFIISNHRMEFTCADAYILSLSGDVVNAGLRSEGNDAVVSISSLHVVAHALAEAHADRLSLPTVAHVRYEPRIIDLRSDDPLNADPFVKDTRFASQHEIRIAWKALDNGTQFFITECPSVARYLQVVGHE